ncbi:MAG: DUF192 domain-containing protein [Paracoccaceae bacterium]
MPGLFRTWLAIVLAIILIQPAFASGACRPDIVWVRQDGNSARFSVEVADTGELRSKGLMFRESLARFAGMLFVYDVPQDVYFWMRNTPLPLDMLFVDKRGVVTRIARDTVPFSEQTIFGGNDVLMVLEVNAGTVDALGLAEGAEIRHPRLDRSVAAWPCPVQ